MYNISSHHMKIWLTACVSVGLSLTQNWEIPFPENLEERIVVVVVIVVGFCWSIKGREEDDEDPFPGQSITKYFINLWMSWQNVIYQYIETTFTSAPRKWVFGRYCEEYHAEKPSEDHNEISNKMIVPIKSVGRNIFSNKI